MVLQSIRLAAAILCRSLGSTYDSAPYPMDALPLADRHRGRLRDASVRADNAMWVPYCCKVLCARGPAMGCGPSRAVADRPWACADVSRSSRDTRSRPLVRTLPARGLIALGQNSLSV